MADEPTKPAPTATTTIATAEIIGRNPEKTTLDKRVIKTIVAVVIGVVLFVILLGACLAIWLPRRYVVLDYWPKFDNYNYDNTLIHLRRGDPGNIRNWVAKMDKYFNDYLGNHTDSRYRTDCSSRAYELRGEYVCDVKIMTGGPCSPGDQYGYLRGTPCVFLQLSQNYWWVPEPYNTTYHLPADMPEDLKRHISQKRSIHEANKVWVSCAGENSLDQENIGPIQYYPDRGFPAYYFPYTSRPGYLSPYVAIHFENPRPGMVVNVECRAWAHNIQYDRYYRRGSVHFEILVD